MSSRDFFIASQAEDEVSLVRRRYCQETNFSVFKYFEL